ncbi:hypothetical protein HK100_003235 [Physocladia obscura]|uniref:Uncharacterized protein n=1 Tax=Physocladia obscura TaxID=109957 RepID=A0AAD5SX51_9FUNG|nr:hypothetical protein HK100_003235 [Physocladia obscura]
MTLEDDYKFAAGAEETSGVAELHGLSGKYVESLEQRLALAGRVERAEERANALVADVRALRAEAAELRRLLGPAPQVSTAALPPPSLLSAFAHAAIADRHAADTTTQTIPGQTPSPALLANTASSASASVSVHNTASSQFSLPNNRFSSVAIDPASTSLVLDSDGAIVLGIPKKTENSFLHISTSKIPTPSSNSPIQEATPFATNAPPTPQPAFQQPTTSKRNSFSSEEFIPSVHRVYRSNSTTTTTLRKHTTGSHTQDHTTSPLPPHSLAWTDIIRMRYPYFQRSTVQTSKHAREFIETRNIPFFRVTPTHSLGRSKPTYAIPPDMQTEFLEYFEDKFGAIGVLGRKRPGGDIATGMPGFDDSSTKEDAVAVTSKSDAKAVTGGNMASAVALNKLGDSLSFAVNNGTATATGGFPAATTIVTASSNLSASSLSSGTSHSSKRRQEHVFDNHAIMNSNGVDKGNVNNSSTDFANNTLNGNGEGTNDNNGTGITSTNSNGLAKRRKPLTGSVVVIPTGSKTVLSKSGLVLTRYNIIINKMMPDFKALSNDARLAIKRGVKQFLQLEMGLDFAECIVMTASENGQSQKQTYGVPEHLIPGFQEWVYVELKKCFPDSIIVAPPSLAIV